MFSRDELVVSGVETLYVPVLPNKLLNLLDIGELIENTGVEEPRDVDFECCEDHLDSENFFSKASCTF